MLHIFELKTIKTVTMKTKFFIITLCLAVACLGVDAKNKSKTKTAKAITGKSLSNFGEYSISKSGQAMVIKGEELKTYELAYENTDNTVQIGVIPEKNCTNFILKTDKFEIEYVCNKGVFGVKKIRKAYMDIPKDMNEAVLDKVGYYSQRVITQNPKTEEELLGLIACYFPSLIKDQYKKTF